MEPEVASYARDDMDVFQPDHEDTLAGGAQVLGGDTEEAILIPVHGSDESVRVNVSELPKDANDIVDILKAELAPLDVWLKFAVEYYKQGMPENFKLILDEGSDESLEHVPRYMDEESKRQRIAILNVLAGYYIRLAAKAKDAQRDQFYDLATNNYNKADKIDVQQEMTWVGKGVLLLCKGSAERADKYFDTVLGANPANAPALLGKACIAYNKKNYEEAFGYYRRVLELNPACPGAVRLGLAFCHYRLNRLELARNAFERVLVLEPDNVPALAALAVLELNTAKPKAVRRAMSLLKQAYDVDPTSAFVLNHLANYFFYKKEYQKTIHLAQAAFNNTTVREIKAESFFHFGRAYHAQEDFEKASGCYYQATELWPEFTLAHYGLGQMYLAKGETVKAIASFEVVHKKYPENYETLKVLASLYAHTGKRDKAIHHFRRITETHPKDTEAWVELGDLVERQKNYTEALKAYEKATSLLQAQGEPVPIELWNNVGVLRHQLGNVEGAEQAYRLALAESGATEETFKALDITTLYNLGRLYETQHKSEQATNLYKAILKEHPNYVDCYLRLGCMARDKGHIFEASEWFKETFAINESHPEAWCLLGNLHLQKEEWQPGQKKFEHILKIASSDPYVLLSLGNIFYAAKFDKKDRAEKYLQHAMDHYWRVLLKNPANMYAANGLGVVLAERGELNEAKDFFIKVREATTTMPDVWLNLGHVYLAQGEFVNAIKMYQNCLRKFHGNKDPEIMLFLAKAYFEYGHMLECKQVLLKALRITPNNNQLWFNVALSQETFARQVVKKEKGSLTEMKTALAELRVAERTFTHLATIPTRTPHARLNFNPKKAEKHAAQCLTYAATLEAQVAKAETDETVIATKREAARKAAAAEIEKRREAEMLKVKAIEEEKARLQQIAEEKKKHLELLQASWASREAPAPREKEPKKGSRRQSSSTAESSERRSGSSSSTSTPKKRRKSDDFYSDTELNEEDEDDDDDLGLPSSPKSDEEGEADHGSDGGEEEAKKVSRRKSRGGKRQRKSKDKEDEDEEGEEERQDEGEGEGEAAAEQGAGKKRKKRSGSASGSMRQKLASLVSKQKKSKDAESGRRKRRSSSSHQEEQEQDDEGREAEEPEHEQEEEEMKEKEKERSPRRGDEGEEAEHAAPMADLDDVLEAELRNQEEEANSNNQEDEKNDQPQEQATNNDIDIGIDAAPAAPAEPLEAMQAE